MVCESAALLLLCVHVWIWPDGCRGMKSCVQQLVFLSLLGSDTGKRLRYSDLSDIVPFFFCLVCQPHDDVYTS